MTTKSEVPSLTFFNPLFSLHINCREADFLSLSCFGCALRLPMEKLSVIVARFLSLSKGQQKAYGGWCHVHGITAWQHRDHLSRSIDTEQLIGERFLPIKGAVYAVCQPVEIRVESAGNNTAMVGILLV